MLHILHTAASLVSTLYLSVFFYQETRPIHFPMQMLKDAAIFLLHLPVMHLPMCAVSAIIHTDEKLK